VVTVVVLVEILVVLVEILVVLVDVGHPHEVITTTSSPRRHPPRNHHHHDVTPWRSSPRGHHQVGCVGVESSAGRLCWPVVGGRSPTSPAWVGRDPRSSRAARPVRLASRAPRTLK